MSVIAIKTHLCYLILLMGIQVKWVNFHLFALTNAKKNFFSLVALKVQLAPNEQEWFTLNKNI